MTVSKHLRFRGCVRCASDDREPCKAGMQAFGAFTYSKFRELTAVVSQKSLQEYP